MLNEALSDYSYGLWIEEWSVLEARMVHRLRSIRVFSVQDKASYIDQKAAFHNEIRELAIAFPGRL